MSITWKPADDGSGDQRVYLPGTPGILYWGEVSREGRSDWLWTVMGRTATTTWTVASGFSRSESEAKAVVESWRPNRGHRS
ncbi:hypothetical protein PAPHU_86 [Mycobacterium phage Paphu]|nr:hypothetical protein PAPHU_86 [Mycobacterium phage Paphu]